VALKLDSQTGSQTMMTEPIDGACKTVLPSGENLAQLRPFSVNFQTE